MLSIHDLRDAYIRLRPLALRVAQSALGQQDGAEDVVQDVFLHLWQHPRAYDPERGSLRAYVAMVTRSRAIDRWRSTASHQAALERAAGELDLRPQAGEGAAEQVITRERDRRALEALDALPGEQRDAVLLASVGFTATEIARHARLPLGTAKSRLRLGLAKARAQLGAA